MTARSRGGRDNRAQHQAELGRKRVERARYAGGAYSFIRNNPECSTRWHPVYDAELHLYRLLRKEDADWRVFLRERGWQVGERGRERRSAAHLRRLTQWGTRPHRQS
jgi:hypothetical protein